MAQSLKDIWGPGHVSKLIGPRGGHRLVGGSTDWNFNPASTPNFPNVDAYGKYYGYGQNEALPIDEAYIASQNPDITGFPAYNAAMFQDENLVGTNTHPAVPGKIADAVVGTNPQGLGPPDMYNDDYGASFIPARGTGLEPGVVPDSMVTPSRSGLEWAGPPPTTSTTTGFTPDTIAEGPHENEPTYAYDPVPGRNLGILDASKGSFYDAYMAKQTVPSRIMSAVGPYIGGGTAVPNMFTAAKGVGKWLAGDRDKKTRGGSFIPSFSNIGRVSQGDRFANLMAAQHYADQGPEGWVQSDFVGNYNPLEGRTGYGNRMGSINQEEAHLQEGIDRAGGWSLGELFGGTAEQDSNDDRGGGGWFGGLFGG